MINGQYEVVPEFRDGQVGTRSDATPKPGEKLREMSSIPSDSTTSVEETNKPEKDESKDETSTKPENSGNAITEENGQTVPTESNQGDTNKVGESNKPEK